MVFLIFAKNAISLNISVSLVDDDRYSSYVINSSSFHIPFFPVSIYRIVLFTNYHVKEEVEHVEYFSSNGGCSTKSISCRVYLEEIFSKREFFNQLLALGFYFLLFPLDTLESFTLKCILITLIGQSRKPWTPCV